MKILKKLEKKEKNLERKAKITKSSISTSRINITLVGKIKKYQNYN